MRLRLEDPDQDPEESERRGELSPGPRDSVAASVVYPDWFRFLKSHKD